MEQCKISMLLDDLIVSRFVARKWFEVNDLSGSQYYVNNNIRFRTPMLRSDLCDYSDVYIVVKGTIDLGIDGENDMTQQGAVFKNIVPFRSWISKINNTFVDTAEDFDTVMQMYNLLEYNDNYSMA